MGRERISKFRTPSFEILERLEFYWKLIYEIEYLLQNSNISNASRNIKCNINTIMNVVYILKSIKISLPKNTIFLFSV